MCQKSPKPFVSATSSAMTPKITAPVNHNLWCTWKLSFWGGLLFYIVSYIVRNHSRPLLTSPYINWSSNIMTAANMSSAKSLKFGHWLWDVFDPHVRTGFPVMTCLSRWVTPRVDEKFTMVFRDGKKMKNHYKSSQLMRELSNSTEYLRKSIPKK